MKAQVEYIPPPEVDSPEEPVELSSLMEEAYSQFTDDLPMDENRCMDVIGGQLILLSQQSTVRYWFVGRVLNHLETNLGVPDAMTRVAGMLGTKKRTVQYIKALYMKIPDFEELLKAVQAGITWTGVKQLCSVEPEEKRSELLDRLGSGEISCEDFLAEIGTPEDSGEGEGGLEAGDRELNFGEGEDPSEVDISLEKLSSLAEDLGKLQTKAEKISDGLTEVLIHVTDPELVGEEEYQKVSERLSRLSDEVAKIGLTFQGVARLLGAYIEKEG
jgi:hypothetical protein